MKTNRILMAFILMLTTILAVSAQAKVEKKRTVFNVPMHCISCQKKIEKNIAFEKGVKDLEVNLEKNTVAVTYDSGKTNTENLIKAFKKLGYEATEAKAGTESSKNENKAGNANCTAESNQKK